MRVISDVSGDFDEMLVHGMGIAPGHDQCCGLAVFGVDRAEDVGRPRALVMRCRRSGTSLGPAAGDLVLLPDPGFVLEPDFDHLALGDAGGNLCRCGGEVFLKASTASASCAGCLGRAENFAIAHRMHLAAQGLARRNTELLPLPLRQIAKTPAHNAVEVGRGSALDSLCQRRTLVVIEQRRLAGGLAVDQAVGTASVEPNHLVAHDLNSDAADTSRIGTRPAIINRRQRKQPTRLAGILRLPR